MKPFIWIRSICNRSVGLERHPRFSPELFISCNRSDTLNVADRGGLNNTRRSVKLFGAKATMSTHPSPFPFIFAGVAPFIIVTRANINYSHSYSFNSVAAHRHMLQPSVSATPIDKVADLIGKAVSPSDIINISTGLYPHR